MSPMIIAGDLLAAAITLSGLPPMNAADLPALYAVSKNELVQAICPEKPQECQSIAAIFETERYHILMLSELDMREPEDNSFLLHELVHVLQFRQKGEAGFATCGAIIENERMAYSVQNRYLAMQGIFSQHGLMMRYMQCPAGLADPEPPQMLFR